MPLAPRESLDPVIAGEGRGSDRLHEREL